MYDITVALTCHDPMPDNLAQPFMRALLARLLQWNMPLDPDSPKLTWRKTADGQLFSVYLSLADPEVAARAGQDIILWLQSSPFAHYKEWSWTYYPTDHIPTAVMSFKWH